MSKRDQIIGVAMRLFVEQGFENTPTSQISKESQVATGTLFYYYKTKEELVNEIYLSVKQDMKESLFRDFNYNLQLKEQLELLWNNLLRWGFEKRLENSFLIKFYGSSYISNLTIEKLNEEFKETKELFEKSKKSKLIKDISFDLFQSITLNLSQSFLLELQKKKKLDSKLLDLSFKIYFDSIKDEN